MEIRPICRPSSTWPRGTTCESSKIVPNRSVQKSELAARGPSGTWPLSAFIRQRTWAHSATGDLSLRTIANGPRGCVALREYGWQQRSVSSFAGVNSRLDEIQAAMLRVKLKRLDADNARRSEIARRYAAGLNRPGITIPACSDEVTHVFHQYVIRTAGRDKLRRFLDDAASDRRSLSASRPSSAGLPRPRFERRGH